MQLVLPTTRRTRAIRVAHRTLWLEEDNTAATPSIFLARHQQGSGRCLQKLCSMPEDSSCGAEPSPTDSATNCGGTIYESCYGHCRPTTEVRKRSSLHLMTWMRRLSHHWHKPKDSRSSAAVCQHSSVQSYIAFSMFSVTCPVL